MIGLWILLAAVVALIVVVISEYRRKPADPGLRGLLDDSESRNRDLRSEIARLNRELRNMEESRDYWRGYYENLVLRRDGVDE